MSEEQSLSQKNLTMQYSEQSMCVGSAVTRPLTLHGNGIKNPNNDKCLYDFEQRETEEKTRWIKREGSYKARNHYDSSHKALCEHWQSLWNWTSHHRGLISKRATVFINSLHWMNANNVLIAFYVFLSCLSGTLLISLCWSPSLPGDHANKKKCQHTNIAHILVQHDSQKHKAQYGQ